MEHLKPDELEAIANGAISTKTEKRSVFDEHLSQCAQCQAEMDKVARAQPSSPVLHRKSAANVQRIGRFEIIGKLGSGGMGAVYEAKDPTLNRRVALKVLDPKKAQENSKLVQRFKKEAEIGAQFNKHKSFVEVYESGETGEPPFVVHYIVMELVAGKTLLEKLTDRQKGPIAIRNAAKIIKKLAEAMHAFHSKGYVHRDLKPGNIFVLYEGGGVKIGDFGIAAEENERGLTTTGKCVGTPLYMAPEQVEGAKIFSRETDIYTLGTIFYELLTGSTPFTGKTEGEVFPQIVSKKPAKPSVCNPSVPAMLDAICLRCLMKDPKDRYPDASTLAQDLHRFLNPPAPLPSATLPRPWPKPALYAVCLVAFFVFVIGAAGFLAWVMLDGDLRNDPFAPERKVAEPNVKEQLPGKIETPSETKDSPVERPSNDKEETPLKKEAPDNPPPAVVVPRPEPPNGFKFPGSPWETKPPPTANVALIKELVGHTGRVGCVVFSVNGKILVTGSDDKTVRTWSLPKGEESKVLRGHTSAVSCVAICPEDKLVAASPSGLGFDKSVKVWKLATGEALPGLKVDENRSPWEVNSLAFSRGGEKLAVGTDVRVILWNRTSGQHQTLETFQSTSDYAYAVAFSPRGDTLAAGLHFMIQSAGTDNVKTWTLEPEATPQHDLVKGADWQHDSRGAMVYSPDGAQLAQVVPGESFPAPKPGKVHIWTLGKTPRAESHEVPAGGMYAAVITAKGVTKVAAANALPRRGGFGTPGFGKATPAHHIRLWDSASRQPWTLDTGHNGAVVNMAFSPDGNTLATTSDDTTVRLWDLTTLKKRLE